MNSLAEFPQAAYRRSGKQSYFPGGSETGCEYRLSKLGEESQDLTKPKRKRESLEEPKLSGLSRVLGYSGIVKSIVRDESGGIHCLLSAESAESGQEALYFSRISDGMLVQPCVGDSVLCADTQNDLIVIQVLSRHTENRTLQINCERDIEMLAPRIKLSALDELELSSASKLSLLARDIVSGASRSLVQQARNLMQNAGNFSLTAKGILRSSAKQQLMTAEEDVRIDGKRINMG